MLSNCCNYYIIIIYFTFFLLGKINNCVELRAICTYKTHVLISKSYMFTYNEKKRMNHPLYLRRRREK